MDIGHRAGPVYQLRFALGRLLVEFQDDLKALEPRGLQPGECADVQAALKDTAELFRKRALGPTSASGEVAKHLDKYQRIYVAWNGHEGDDPGKALNRKREIGLLAEQRRKLFHKLSQRQVEISESPQLDLFATSVRTPFSTLARKLPDHFPRLRRATLLFGG